ncbi:MAG TPA: hypothetical protein VIH45_07410 [Desulfuromonadaceae bacterium]
MRIAASLVALLLVAAMACAAPTPPAPAPKMRPYCGIGVLMLAIPSADGESYPLYDEPAIARRGVLDMTRVPPYEWIFGSHGTSLALMVMARKGEWLRVAYDDAGREAWLNPCRPASFHPWEEFLKGQTGTLLPGLQKRYYQLFRQPGAGPLATLPPKQPFLVVKLEQDWALVVATGQTTLGWLRWRDEDGRLLMGLPYKIR